MSDTDTPVLRLTDVAVGYSGHHVLRGVELDLTAGQITGLLGPNGAGKSTLLQTIVGTLTLRAGRIEFAGSSIGSWPAKRRVAAGIGFSPEGRRVFGSLPVTANLLLGNAGLPRRREREGLDEVFALFPELAARPGQPAATLSGGEQQMLAIGRAMMGRPRALLVEEPSQGLAPKVVDRVWAALREVAAGGVAVLVAEQFQQLRRECCDRVVVIKAGTLGAAA